MKKYLAKIGLMLMGLIFVLPTFVSADGGVFPRPDYWIQETEQKAVLFYDQGIETMVVSTKFQGDTSDFAWIIPVPDRPEVTKGSTTLFTALEELTGFNYPVPMRGLTASVGMGAAEQDAVQIIEEKTIDYYDVKVISSTDKNELATWFNENGYHFPEKYSYILNEYVNNGWYFVATKINAANVDVGSIGQSLRTGSATPLQITFKAKNMVYPMRISSIDMRKVIEEEQTVEEPIVAQPELAPLPPLQNNTWDGCRGTGFNVCVDALRPALGSNTTQAQIEQYFQEHPRCAASYTCEGLFAQCEPTCPHPLGLNTSYRPDPDQATLPETRRIPPVYDSPYIQVQLYIISDHKVELPSFTTQYADKIKKDDIKNLAQNSQGDPWITPSSNKMFLTKMIRTMDRADMTEDLFPKQAEDDDKITGGSSGINLSIGQLITMIIVCFLILLLNPLTLIFIISAIIQFYAKSAIARIITWIAEVIIFIITSLLLLGAIFSNWTRGYYLGPDFSLMLIPSLSILVIMLVGMIITIIIQIKKGSSAPTNVNFNIPTPPQTPTLPYNQ